MVTVTNTSIQCGSQRSTRGGGAHRQSKADTHVNGYGRHIGRVGALAVALGIGVAVASTPGVAWADDTGSATSWGHHRNGGRYRHQWNLRIRRHLDHPRNHDGSYGPVGR